MEPITALGWLGQWAIKTLADKSLYLAEKKWKPDALTHMIKVAIEAAEDQKKELFSACRGYSPLEVDEFLQAFFESQVVRQEFRKPLQDLGKPNIDLLIAGFRQLAAEREQTSFYKLDFLQDWMSALVEHYFHQIKGLYFQVTRTDYLKQLAKRVDDIKFVGIAVPGEEVDKQEYLAKIFVMPTVQEIKRGQSIYNEIQDIGKDERLALRAGANESEESIPLQDKLLKEQRAWALRDRKGAKFPAQKLLNQPTNRAILLGAPGSGKSTLLNYFALLLCPQSSDSHTQPTETETDKLPIIVKIRDWVLKPDLGLMAYVRWYAEDSLAMKELPPGFFEHWLDRGQALILLDGLDEVADEAQRRKVVEQIETFLHQYQVNPAIITSRPAGYRWDFFDADEFPHYTLEPFDDEQVEEFIDHWYNSRVTDKAEAERRKADLRKALKGKDRIRQLAKNPLLLTIIALIHRYQAELPRQRYKLYEKAVETLLTSWDSGKEIRLYEQVLQYLKPDDLLYVLKKLAYWIHTQGSTEDVEGGTLIDQQDLIRQLSFEIRKLKDCKSHEANAEAERFVDFIQKRTGLVNEQGRERYAFVHKTFQEYLTAEEIYDRFEEGEDGIIQAHLQNYLHNQHWQEVLLLLVSKLKKVRAAKAIQGILQAGSQYETWLHRDLLFAGWCLTEDPQDLRGGDAEIIGNILEQLIAIFVNPSEKVGNKIILEIESILHRLGETAAEAEAWARLQQNTSRIDRFQLLVLQASLGQEQSAISTLLNMLKNDDSSVRYRAAKSLVQLGQGSGEVVTGLLKLLKDNDSDVRSRAALALGQLCQGSDDVVTGLLKLLEDDTPSVRNLAASALGQLGQGSDNVVTALLKLLKDGDSDVRNRAEKSLVQLGQGSDEVVTGLLKLLKDGTASVRNSAASALGQLGQSSSDVVTGLLKLLEDDAPSVRNSATSALGQLGQGSGDVVTGLLKLIKDNDPDVRFRAALALGQLGQGSGDVVTGLLKLLKDDAVSVRSRAAKSLGQLGQSSGDVVTGLLKLIKDDNLHVRSRAAESLGQLGQSSGDVVTGLLKLIKDDDSDVRSRVAESLGQLGQSSGDVVMGLLKLLKDDAASVRSCAAESLGQLGQSSGDVVMGLLKLLNDDYSKVRNSAASALGQLGQGSDEVVTGLLKLLKDDSLYVRSRAASALSQLGQGSGDVLTCLLKLLKDDAYSVRSRAASALVQLGQGSIDVVTGLLKLLNDDDSEVRSSAVVSLGQLSEKSDQVQPALVQWMQQHQEDGDIGAAIDILWELPHPPYPHA